MSGQQVGAEGGMHSVLGSRPPWATRWWQQLQNMGSLQPNFPMFPEKLACCFLLLMKYDFKRWQQMDPLIFSQNPFHFGGIFDQAGPSGHLSL